MERRLVDVRTLSPHFELPEGVVDFDYEEAEYTDGFDDAAEEITDDTETDDQASESPEVPVILSVTQVYPVRYGPDGSQVIDLIIEVEDLEEIVQYDVRKTKA